MGRLCADVGWGAQMADLPESGPPPEVSPVGRNRPLSFQVACRNALNPAQWWPRRLECDSSCARGIARNWDEHTPPVPSGEGEKGPFARDLTVSELRFRSWAA